MNPSIMIRKVAENGGSAEGNSVFIYVILHAK